VKGLEFLRKYEGLAINVELSGEKRHTGVLVDYGLDILVIYTGEQFIYIPISHIQHIKKHYEDFSEIPLPKEESSIEMVQDLSYRKVLTHSKGVFIEIFVGGNVPIHGYITHVLTNYFVFYSPVYKTVFIPFFHLKWLIPYHSDRTPYSLDKSSLPVNPTNITFVRTFEEQLKRLEGKIVVFDLGLNANKIGYLNRIEYNMIELITGDKNSMYCNIQHIKAVHSPDI
jgi:hypothetical protein